MWIKEQLEALEFQKQNLKVNWFCTIEPHSFEYKGKTIDIKSISNNDWLLTIVAECDWKEDDYNFQNPPILVPDGTYHEETIDWEVKQIPNYKEDLLAVLHIILGDTIII